MFLKPAAILHALELGYAVMMAGREEFHGCLVHAWAWGLGQASTHQILLGMTRATSAACRADTDIAYSVKPVWASYLTYMQQVRADVAWMNASELQPTSLLTLAGSVSGSAVVGNN